MNPWAWISILLVMLGAVIIISGIKGSMQSVCISLTNSTSFCSFLPASKDTTVNETSKQGGGGTSGNSQIITTPAPGAV